MRFWRSGVDGSLFIEVSANQACSIPAAQTFFGFLLRRWELNARRKFEQKAEAQYLLRQNRMETRSLAALGNKNTRISNHQFHKTWGDILGRGFIASLDSMLNTKRESMPSKSNLRKRVGIWFVLECLVIILHYLHTYFR
jgi:hypothetical protein